MTATRHKIQPQGIQRKQLTGEYVREVTEGGVLGGVPVIFRQSFANSSAAVSLTLDYAIEVIDVWAVKTAGATSGDTLTVGNAGVAITEAIVLNIADNLVARCTTISMAKQIAAGGVLRFTPAQTIDCICYVSAIRT
jgi:hypothetical protein